MSTPRLPERVPEDLLPRLQARFGAFPVVEGWNLAIEALGPGTAHLVAGPSPRIRNGASGVLNGGILAALADMGCALALCTAFGGDMPFATSDLHLRYLEPARETAEVRAEVIRISARGAVLECRILSGGVLCVLATAHFALSRSGRPS